MSQHDAVTIRCWQLTGETALEGMVLDVEERAVRDGSNVLLSDFFPGSSTLQQDGHRSVDGKN